MNSIVNGSGLNDSVAGEVSRFSVVLRDAYQYPAPVELETLQVQIIRDLDSYHIQPSIFPMPTENATVTDNWSTSDLEVSSVIHMETASAPTVEPVNNVSGVYCL